MADDTLGTPTPGQEPEPPTAPEPEPTPAPTPEPEPTAPTADDIIAQAGEAAFQRMASWQGRRDKDLLDNVGQIIDSKMTQSQPAPETTMYDDPDGWVEKKFQEKIPQMMDQEIYRRTTQDQQYTSEVIRYAGSLMDKDPMFADKDLGNEVISEVQKNFGSLNKGLTPDVSAQLLVSNAFSNVMRRRNVKGSPLAGNTGAGNVGGITPPAGTPPKAKPVKLTDEAQKLADRWGYSEEDLGKVFGE